jgi:hypothetical protein
VKDEKEMYAPVSAWLKRFLVGLYGRQWEVETYVTFRQNLSYFLSSIEKSALFPEAPCYDIKIDVTGILKKRSPPISGHLAFVECKFGEANILGLSQLLGYSRIAKPLHSFLISLEGPSESIRKLLEHHRRWDILEYEINKKIVICKWDETRNEIDASSILPPGGFSYKIPGLSDVTLRFKAKKNV